MDAHAVLGSDLQQARKILFVHHSTLALFQGFWKKRKKKSMEVTVQNKGEEEICCEHRTLQRDPDYCGFCDSTRPSVRLYLLIFLILVNYYFQWKGAFGLISLNV